MTALRPIKKRGMRSRHPEWVFQFDPGEGGMKRSVLGVRIFGARYQHDSDSLSRGLCRGENVPGPLPLSVIASQADKPSESLDPSTRCFINMGFFYPGRPRSGRAFCFYKGETKVLVREMVFPRVYFVLRGVYR